MKSSPSIQKRFAREGQIGPIRGRGRLGLGRGCCGGRALPPVRASDWGKRLGEETRRGDSDWGGSAVRGTPGEGQRQAPAGTQGARQPLARGHRILDLAIRAGVTRVARNRAKVAIPVRPGRGGPASRASPGQAVAARASPGGRRGAVRRAPRGRPAGRARRGRRVAGVGAAP
jgi:hypothetical protein